MTAPGAVRPDDGGQPVAAPRAGRGRLLALLAVLALLAGALVLGSRGGSTPAPPESTGLAGLREAAALAPCPAGLSPALPDLVLPCVGAEGEVRAQAAPGRPTLVNVWATWCGPCVREVPLLQSVHERSDEVDVVGVLTQDTAENGLAFADDASLGFDMTYASVLDENGVVMREFGPGPPITLFVRADGTVAHTEIGEMTDQAEVDALVRAHLGVRL